MSKTIEECHNELLALKPITGNTYHFSFFSEAMDKGSYSFNKDDGAFGITGPYLLSERDGDVWITLRNAKGTTEDNEPTQDNRLKIRIERLTRKLHEAEQGPMLLYINFDDFIYLLQQDCFYLEALY